jgi:hypothetical protein
VVCDQALEPNTVVDTVSVATANNVRRESFIQAAGAVALRQLQWKHAKRPDASGVAMTIHMSKHLLGQNDKALHLNLTAGDVDELIARLEHERAQQLAPCPRLRYTARAA